MGVSRASAAMAQTTNLGANLYPRKRDSAGGTPALPGQLACRAPLSLLAPLSSLLECV